MENQEFNQELLDYLYDEMNSAQRIDFEKRLKGDKEQIERIAKALIARSVGDFEGWQPHAHRGVRTRVCASPVACIVAHSAYAAARLKDHKELLTSRGQEQQPRLVWLQVADGAVGRAHREGQRQNLVLS